MVGLMKTSFLILIVIIMLSNGYKTTISIKGTNFEINGGTTYANANNHNVRGLLINARMINAIFDDSNKTTQYLWEYPDTHKWDPNRNTNEFVSNISMYKNHGMLSFTVGLQGGNPFGYGRNEPNNISGQPWDNSAYQSNGDLNTPYFTRIEKIITEADNNGVVPIVQLFYAAQESKMENDNARIRAINNTLDWIMSKGYTNILIEVANECNLNHDNLSEDNMPNIIKYMKEYTNNKYYFGSSTTGGRIPSSDLIKESDFVLLHGNGQSSSGIKNMIDGVRNNNEYKNNPKPIVFNEDDHYDFSSSNSNFQVAINNHASWGVFVDCDQQTAGDYIHGYQCVPAAWDENTSLKEQWFAAVKAATS